MPGGSGGGNHKAAAADGTQRVLKKHDGFISGLGFDPSGREEGVMKMMTSSFIKHTNNLCLSSKKQRKKHSSFFCSFCSSWPTFTSVCQQRLRFCLDLWAEQHQNRSSTLPSGRACYKVKSRFTADRSPPGSDVFDFSSGGSLRGENTKTRENQVSSLPPLG